MTEIRISRAAAADIVTLKSYSEAAFGAAVAARYLDKLEKSLRLLVEHPMAGASEDMLGAGLRGLNSGSHRIYYRFDGHELLIVRILHNRQDIRSALGEAG